MTLELAAAWFAIVVIVAVGVNLLLQRERRRRDDASGRDAVPVGVDPASLRRNRPRTARLTGTALIVAALILVGALRKALGVA